MRGKLIVIEGLDGCGKNTQTNLLVNYFKDKGEKVRYLSFPDYSQPSSSLIKMYLNSEFGDAPNDVNAYAAASFFAIDRFASFKKSWSKDYENGCTVICDRYTTSNAFYQMCKLEDYLWEEYLAWLYDYEYNKLGLPRPDVVLYLKVPIELSQNLITNRYHGNENKKDLHESNTLFLKNCERTANYVAKRDKWSIIECCKGINMKSKLSIHEEIVNCIEGEI